MSNLQQAIPFALLGIVTLAGCEVDLSEDYSQSYTAPEPAHPAMKAPVGVKTRARPQSPHAHGRADLPADHPPIEGGAREPARPLRRPPENAALAQSGPVVIGGLSFEVPEGWVREAPRTQMRLAQFRLPRADGDQYDGEVTVIAAFGLLDANISRWEGQFRERPKAVVDKRQAGGFNVTVVSIEGTFMHKSRPMARGPGEPRPGYSLYAAIVQTPKEQLFFKGWGPKKTMEKWRPGFDELIQSFREAQ